MALSLQERVYAVSMTTPPQPTTYRVIGALAKHAKYILRTAGQHPPAHVEFATGVVAVPDMFAYRFGVAALTEPVFDAIESVNEITDQQLQDAVAELWSLFASPVAEP